MNMQSRVEQVLGVRISNNSEKYLGFSTMVGRRKKHAFLELKEKVGKRINGWST